MSPRAVFCAILILSLLQPGCALTRLWPRKKKPTAAAYVPLPVTVGTITLVNEEGKFVLVDNGAHPAPPVGATLKTYTGGSDTASGELVATDVRRRPFTIADIRTGAPRKGDRVLYIPPELRRPAGAAPERVVDQRAASSGEELPTGGVAQ